MLIVREQFYRQYFRFSRMHKPEKIILMFGHMRSGSTLLTKILCSNPEILGYGETHVYYESTKDIEFASGKILFVLREWIKNNKGMTDNTNYFFDKVLHNSLMPKEDSPLFLNDNIKIIFLIRESEGTLSSILNMPQLKLSDERSACDHYTKRLDRLAQFGEFLQGKKPYFCMTYQQVLYDTSNLFGRLEEFLGLTHPLTEDYEVILNRSGAGDSSAKLLSGRINREKNNKSDIIISKQILEEAKASFNKTLATLSSASVLF